jgi:hypothetical protein
VPEVAEMSLGAHTLVKNLCRCCCVDSDVFDFDSCCRLINQLAFLILPHLVLKMRRGDRGEDVSVM